MVLEVWLGIRRSIAINFAIKNTWISFRKRLYDSI